MLVLCFHSLSCMRAILAFFPSYTLTSESELPSSARVGAWSLFLWKPLVLFAWSDEPLAKESELDAFLAASGAETSGQSITFLSHNKTCGCMGAQVCVFEKVWAKVSPQVDSTSWCYTHTHNMWVTQCAQMTMFMDRFEACPTDRARQLSTPSFVPHIKRYIQKVARLDQKLQIRDRVYSLLNQVFQLNC